MYNGGRYDYADIGQRIMCARSSDGLCKRAVAPQHSPAKRFPSGTTRHLPLNGEG